MKGERCHQTQNKAWQLNSKIILALMVGQVVDEEGEKEGETPIRKAKMAGVMLFYLRKEGSAIEKGKLFFKSFFTDKLLKCEGVSNMIYLYCPNKIFLSCGYRGRDGQ